MVVCTEPAAGGGGGGDEADAGPDVGLYVLVMPGLEVPELAGELGKDPADGSRPLPERALKTRISPVKKKVRSLEIPIRQSFGAPV